MSDDEVASVLKGNTLIKTRLYGIDCPEKSQAFGTKSKQFASDIVFGKIVTVVPTDTNRYGRIVGMVYVGGVCVNAEMIKNGFAWVYPSYCKIAICSDWLELEKQARAGKVGLWAHSNPIPPWEYRRKKT